MNNFYLKNAINLNIFREVHWKIADLWWIVHWSFVKQRSNCRVTFWGKTVFQRNVFFDFFSDIEWQAFKVPTILFPHGCTNYFLLVRIRKKYVQILRRKILFFEINCTLHRLSDSEQKNISSSLPSFWQGCQSCFLCVHGISLGKKFFLKKKVLLIKLLNLNLKHSLFSRKLLHSFFKIAI